MSRIGLLETQQASTDEKLDRMIESLDNLPKKILQWLLIIGALFTILQFIGPSIRKTIGLASTHVPFTFAAERPQDVSIPPLAR